MELLVYLGVQDPSGVRAELLGDSLWSEEDDDESRTERIRKRRYTMRQALKKLVPELDGNPIAPFDKKNPVYRLNASVIEAMCTALSNWCRKRRPFRQSLLARRTRRHWTCTVATFWNDPMCRRIGGWTKVRA
jgi:hypothetical protein